MALSDLTLDLRLALRRLRARPGRSLVLVTTLAVAVGAVTAVVGVAWAVLGRPLPFPEADRLGFVWAHEADEPEVWLSPPEVDDLARGEGSPFDAVAPLRDLTLRVSGPPPAPADPVRASDGQRAADRSVPLDEPLEVEALAVSAELFALLGVHPTRGRVFTTADDRVGAPPVVLVSDGFWRRRLGADPSVVGRALWLDGRPHEVVGVLPPSFRLLPPSSVFPEDAGVWVPYRLHLPDFARANRTVRFVHVLARRAPGVSPERAQAALATLSRDLRRAHPEVYDPGFRLTLREAREQLVGDARPALLMLVAAAALLWLIACVNVAGLELAALAGRCRELAVRSALGAGRGRVFRQLFVETLVLAVTGGVLGLFVAEATRRALVTLGGASVPRLDEARLDPLWLAVALGATLSTLLICGLLPGLRGARAGLAPGLRGRVGTRGEGGARDALVIAQVALALVVLVGAGLLGRSFERVLAVDRGFRADGVLTLRLTLPEDRYADGARQAAFFTRAVGEIEALEPVRAAGAVTQLPLSGAQLGSVFTARDALPGTPEETTADLRGVTPGYFRTLAIPLLAGRGFTGGDGPNAPEVAVVDESFARRHWPGQDPVGRRVVWRRAERELTVVGVVPPVRHDGPEAATRPTVYRPAAQYPRATMYLVAEVAGAPSLTVADAARARLRELDPTVPVAEVAALDDLAGDAVAERRFGTVLMGTLSLLALGLALLGLYGLITEWVVRRTGEIGVRFALGASPSSVLLLVLGRGARLAALGLGLGLLTALAGARLLRHRLDPVVFGVSPTDPVVFLSVSLVLVLGAFVFLLLPARRAARLDPARLLRD